MLIILCMFAWRHVYSKRKIYDCFASNYFDLFQVINTLVVHFIYFHGVRVTWNIIAILQAHAEGGGLNTKISNASVTFLFPNDGEKEKRWCYFYAPVFRISLMTKARQKPKKAAWIKVHSWCSLTRKNGTSHERKKFIFALKMISCEADSSAIIRLICRPPKVTQSA